MFILRRELTIEHSVHFYTTVSFYSVSHTLEHYFFRIFQKSSRLDIIHIDHSACQYMAFVKCGFDLSPYERSFVATHVPATNETSQFCTRESRNPRHHGLSMSICDERQTLSTTKFFEPLNAFA